MNKKCYRVGELLTFSLERAEEEQLAFPKFAIEVWAYESTYRGPVKSTGSDLKDPYKHVKQS